MKLISNSGDVRVASQLQEHLVSDSCVSIASPQFSVFAFAELRKALKKTKACRLVMPPFDPEQMRTWGSETDRGRRNQLDLQFLAAECGKWIENGVEVRQAPGALPQSTIMLEDSDGRVRNVILGDCPFTTEGLGLGTRNPLGLIQSAEDTVECETLAKWFQTLWDNVATSTSTSTSSRIFQRVRSPIS